MKSKVVHLSLAAAAAALLLAACGGGGGGGGDTPSLNLAGTAATGAALAGANVEVKCASGTGTATTSSAGAYTVSMEGGVLPCIVRVTGTTAGGSSVTLHSVVETGASTSGDTAAVANVTPITEMIVAQLLEQMPTAAFDSFDPSGVTQQALSTATTTIVEALKTAGIDLGSIDPLKDPLVPPSGAAAGNTYDQLLDRLGEQVTVEALPQLVNQIATAAATDSSSGLGDAMVAVSGGTLEGCPSAISGKYRTIEYYGRTVVREVDFKNKKFMSGNGVDSYDIVVDPAKPCEFTASGTINGTTSVFHVAIGPNGVGAFRAQQTAPSVTPGVIGYLFPVQSHDVAAMAGNWTFLESGFDAEEGHVHWVGDATFSGDTATFCDYDKAASWGCVESSRATVTLANRSDGGVATVQAGVDEAVFYGYRAPNGSFTVFGSSNPAGTTGNVDQTSIVLTQRTTMALREVGSVSKSWDVDLVVRSTGRTTGGPTATSNTVLSNDPATGAVTRKRESDCRVDTLYYNQPIAGVVKRDAGTSTNCAGQSIGISAVYILPLTGLGMTAAISQQQGGFFSSPVTHIYSISPRRP